MVMDDTAVYDLLKNGDKRKCPKCAYAPILGWFNYCPMCVYKFSKQFNDPLLHPPTYHLGVAGEVWYGTA